MNFLDLVQTPVSEAIGWTLFHSLWEGILVAAIFVVFLVSVRSPRARYIAGCVALAGMLAGFAVTLWHFWPASKGSGRVFFNVNLSMWTHIPDGNGSNSYLPDFTRMLPYLAPAWLVGVCLFYLREAAGWLSILTWRRRGVCKPPDLWQRAIGRLCAELKLSRPVVLLESVLVDAPVVIGHFRPVILAPLGCLTGLPTDQVESILLHELAHISRSDYVMNLCQRLVEGLFFYHPAVWWISRVIRNERENCCDDIVVALRGDVRSYALALTELERNRLAQNWAKPKQAVAVSGGILMKRVKRLLYPQRPSGIGAPVLAILFLVASTATVFAAWHVNVGSNQTSEQTSKESAAVWRK